MPEGLSAPELLRDVYGACGLDSWLRRVKLRSRLGAFGVRGQVVDSGFNSTPALTACQKTNFMSKPMDIKLRIGKPWT